MYREVELPIILNRARSALTLPDPTASAIRGDDSSGVFSACTQARKLSGMQSDREITVWLFTMSRGVQPVARYFGGTPDEDGVACLGNHAFWHTEQILKVVAEHLSQQVLILDMESNQDNTTVVCAAE